MTSRVIWGKRFLVYRLEYGNVLLFGVSEEVSSACAVLGELRVEFHIEALPDLLKDGLQRARAVEGPIDVNVRAHPVDLRLYPKHNNYIRSLRFREILNLTIDFGEDVVEFEALGVIELVVIEEEPLSVHLVSGPHLDFLLQLL